MRSPLLFLVFNRPNTTREVFEQIRCAKPSRLYISADGPRLNRQGETQRCEEVRAIVAGVNWKCEVKTLFRNENLGCRVGVSEGVDWFFRQETEGVILEDDVLPVETFFDYCDQLLHKYRDDPRVAMISGCNLVSSRFKTADSYFFSRYPYIWGWASWRRVWQQYDVNMTEWPAWRDAGGLKKISGGKVLVDYYWRRVLNATYNRSIDTWDYQFFFACWRMGGLAILPSPSQTRNLGFGVDATHTLSSAPDFVISSVASPLSLPLIHPAVVCRAKNADDIYDAIVFKISVAGLLKLILLDFPLIKRWGLRRAAKRSQSSAHRAVN